MHAYIVFALYVCRHGRGAHEQAATAARRVGPSGPGFRACPRHASPRLRPTGEVNYINFPGGTAELRSAMSAVCRVQLM